MTRYCVIGAGAAGLSALQQLRDAGYDVDCYEKTDRVGGHWNTDYDALHMITARDMTFFEGFPMPEAYPHFPRRDEVVDYMNAYADHHGHHDIIRFGTEVTSVTPIETDGPVGSAGWTVRLATGEEVAYDGVMVANGHLWDPYVPAVAGEFTGTQIHSGDYHNTDEVTGDRVLVVGSGNSGCDLAADCAQHRLEVDIVVREGIYFTPKAFFGVPRQQVSFLSEFGPSDQDLIARLLARVAVGEWHNYPGMPKPKHDTLAESRAVVNDLLLYWIQHGRIKVRPAISRFDGDTVTFADGSEASYDTVLWATGFRATLPFLDESLLERSNGVPLRYAGGIIPAGLEKLYFIGLSAPRGPQIPIYGMQAKVAIKMIELHEAAGGAGAGVASYLAGLQSPADRIDVVRAPWLEEMADTERLLDALAVARG